MRARARGAGLLIAVLLIVTVASFAVIVAASQMGGDIQGNDALADSIEALYLAESGVERALKRYATGVANCGLTPPTLRETITDLSQFGPAGAFPRGRTIEIYEGLTTDFGGANLVAAQTQCRVYVTATIGSSNVSRTIHAIVDRNLLEGPDNPTFNNPSTAGAPTGWTINTAPGGAVGYANTGGADCTRSAWLVKTAQGNFTSTAQISVPVAFSVVAASQTIVTFHWRLGSRTPVAGCANGGNTGPAFPGLPCPVAGGDGQACFRFTPAGAGGGNFMQKNLAVAATIAVACPGTIDPGTPGPYAPCTSQYQNPPTAGMAYPNKEQLTFNMGGGNITQFLLNLRLRNAGRKEIFIDHIEARNTTAIGAAHVRVWRDCSSAADPATCL